MGAYPRKSSCTAAKEEAMNYDRDQFLQDVFERLVKLPGDPVHQIDRAVEAEIEFVAKSLKHLAQQEREALVTMAEQRKANPREMVKTLWHQAKVEPNYHGQIKLSPKEIARADGPHT